MTHVSETAWEAGTQLPAAARWPPCPGHELHCSLRTRGGRGGGPGGECAVTARLVNHTPNYDLRFFREEWLWALEEMNHADIIIVLFCFSPDFPLALQINPQITYWSSLDSENSIRLHDLFLKWFPQLKESLKESVLPVLHRHRKIAITIIIRCCVFFFFFWYQIY